MANYNFRNKETQEIFEVSMRISELDQYKADHPELEQVHINVNLHSGRGMQKPDQNFRDLLSNIDKNASKGLQKSKINTW